MAAEKSSLRLLVNKAAVGAIIGKAGSTIQKINQTTGANIGIEKQYTEDRYLREHVRDVVLTISYTEQKQMIDALAELAPILHAARQELASQRPNPKTIPADEHYFTALIHSTGVRNLLENEGAQIKQVQEQSAAIISIRDRLPSSTECSISFKGTIEQVIKAFTACLTALLDRSGTEKSAFRPYSASILPRPNDEISTRTFDIPASKTGPLLRSSGARVKFIRKVTSCSVSIDAKEGQDKATVTVSGPQSNLQHAVSMVRFTQSPPANNNTATRSQQ